MVEEVHGRRPWLGLTRVATREESGVLGFPSRRGLTPRGSLECNPEIPAFPGEEYYMGETWVRSLGWEDPLEKGKAT